MLVPEQVRARTSATFLFATAMLGGGGPLAAGLISDALMPAHGIEALRYGLLLVPAMGCGAMLLYLAAARRYVADVERAARLFA